MLSGAIGLLKPNIGLFINGLSIFIYAFEVRGKGRREGENMKYIHNSKCILFLNILSHDKH